ncbi:MAG: transcription antitermination factor NusB [Defluviitaleaceae bacterium]|nr:transcription antitermination factor NusB [Defluviitaleaceae bacterium]
MSRKTARRHAFHLIFGLPFNAGSNVESTARANAAYYEFLDEKSGEDYGFDAADFSRPKGRDAEYVNRAFRGVFDRTAELDGVIENFLRDWTIDRINKVDLAVMRLSIYEMLCEPDVPSGASVNEAVELAKEYGADDSPAFVNGVLGNVAREINAHGFQRKQG